MTELALAAFAAASRRALRRRPPKRPRRGLRRAFRRRFDEASFRVGLRDRGFRWVARSEPAFPPLLAAIHDPPAGLFLRGGGDSVLLSRPAVAVVGARSCSPYGSQVARPADASSPAPGSSSSAGSPAASTARLIAEHSKQAASPSRCSVAAIDRDYPASHRELAARSLRDGAGRLGVRARESSRLRGGSLLGTGSSPASRGRWSSWRRASEAAR